MMRANRTEDLCSLTLLEITIATLRNSLHAPRQQQPKKATAETDTATDALLPDNCDI